MVAKSPSRRQERRPDDVARWIQAQGSCNLILPRAGRVAQSVEYLTSNQAVAGSTPAVI